MAGITAIQRMPPKFVAVHIWRKELLAQQLTEKSCQEEPRDQKEEPKE